MASVPITHNEMLKTQAVSNLMTSLVKGSPELRDLALQGLASIANTPKGGESSIPSSPKVCNHSKGASS